MKFDINKLRIACCLAAQTLKATGEIIRPGITTDALNAFAHNDTFKRGGIPAPLNYHGFPKSICTSVNDVVCHGIPGPYVLKDGDIINIDVTTIIDGHFGDTSATFLVGECSEDVKRLVGTTHQAMTVGINVVKPGLLLGVIGTAIQAFVETQGYSVVKEYGGHGIGTLFHGEPFVRHFSNVEGPVLEPGMIFTIEPMINAGKREVLLSDDGWTVCTADMSLSCQFEHTILVTDDGYEVLTQC